VSREHPGGEGIRWIPRSDRTATALEPLLRGLLAQVASGASPDRKRGRRKRLHRLRGEDGAEYLLKVNRYRGLQAWLRRWRGGKARRELAAAEALVARGVSTPVPLAAGERLRRGRLVADYLLVEALPDAVELGAAWADPACTPARRRALAAGFGALVRRLEAAGLHHRDLAPNNVLVRGEPPELLPIDFERARLGRLRPGLRGAGAPRRGSIGRSARRRALARLARRVGREASAAERLRFLRAYAGGDRRRARAWWRAVAREAPRQARRDLAHWWRTATAGGRRFARLPGGGPGAWEGFVRRDPARPRSTEGLLAAAERALVRGSPEIAADPEAPLWSVVCARSSSRRALARRWALAQLLWGGWALVPRPLALLWRPGGVVLLLERPAGARHLAERTAERDSPGEPPLPEAVRVLIAHLEALGRLRARPGRAELALHPAPRGRGRAVLLDPGLWELASPVARLGQLLPVRGLRGARSREGPGLRPGPGSGSGARRRR